MVIRILCSLLLFIIASPAFALSQVQATVDRNPVVAGEYFVLDIVADDDLNAGALDTSILLDDFIVGRTSVGRSTKMVNFDTTRETRWQVLLSPKSMGMVTIPSFNIKGVSSNPINLKVIQQGAKADERQNVFIKVQTNASEAYVGQLITYKVKLYLAVELQRGVLSAPAVEGAQIKQIGEDKDSSEILDGRRFRVIERTYGIIADLPGELVINGASFSGDVLIESQRRGGMFGFNESRPMQTEAEREVIQVNSIPPSYQGKWLVSDIVMLKETWPEDISEFEVGSPITRTVSLIASNTDDTSLPDIEIPLAEGLKAYPEKPVRQTFVRDNQVVSQYSLTTAIVPTKPGTYTLPEIRVPWWNPYIKKQQFATLPERTIRVIGSSAATTDIPAADSFSPVNNQQYWPIIAGGFALLWLVTLVLWRRAVSASYSYNPQHDIHSKDNGPRKTATTGLNAIIHACDRNDSSAAITAVQAYFSERIGQPMTLSQISNLSAPLASAIHKLQADKYSRQPQAMDKKSLMDAILAYKEQPQSHKKSLIADLNP
ncbi:MULTISPECIES: BatD family protein [Shewanella]|uniref:BatD family protein n=1 Tax=Shewanella metallivivens TaxID=2872342 RepID=A0ABT5TKW7_9GAMM|nr:BatD family protein [Shewanella metallivivens]